MNNNSEMMSWQDKIESAKKVMEVLKNVKDVKKERDIIDILELSAKLSLPGCHVRLLVEGF